MAYKNNHLLFSMILWVDLASRHGPSAPWGLWILHSGPLSSTRSPSTWPLRFMASLQHGSWLLRGRKQKLPVLLKAVSARSHSIISVAFFCSKQVPRPAHIQGRRRQLHHFMGVAVINLWPLLIQHSSLSGHKLVTFLPHAEYSYALPGTPKVLSSAASSSESSIMRSTSGANANVAPGNSFLQVQVCGCGTSRSGDPGTKKISYLNLIYPTQRWDRYRKTSVGTPIQKSWGSGR